MLILKSVIFQYLNFFIFPRVKEVNFFLEALIVNSKAIVKSCIYL